MKTVLLVAFLLTEWNCNEKPTHHVSLLEIPPRASRMDIVTIRAPLRQGFVGIDGVKNPSLPVGCHTYIRTIRIPENLHQRSPLELRRRTVLFVDRPIADQSEPNPIGLFGHELPGLPQELGG